MVSEHYILLLESRKGGPSELPHYEEPTDLHYIAKASYKLDHWRSECAISTNVTTETRKNVLRSNHPHMCLVRSWQAQGCV